jgi:diguanylate cyclase (GGDEF)-like protein
LLSLALGLGAVFGLDHVTGEAPVQHLYYVPLGFAALRFGAAGGLAAAGVAIVLYHVANAHLLAIGYNHADVLQMLLFAGLPLITAKLASDARRLRQLASTDDITGLSNLRRFEYDLAEMIREARLWQGTVSMLVLDVDRLKSLNDKYGHLAGADAVRTIGRIIAEVVPRAAASCRYGGDEFAIAIPCGTAEARAVAEEILHRVIQTAPTLAGRAMLSGTLSVSIGVATLVSPPDGRVEVAEADEGERLFHAADQALYAAKRSGRSRTAVAG